MPILGFRNWKGFCRHVTVHWQLLSTILFDKNRPSVKFIIVDKIQFCYEGGTICCLFFESALGFYPSVKPIFASKKNSLIFGTCLWLPIAFLLGKMPKKSDPKSCVFGERALWPADCPANNLRRCPSSCLKHKPEACRKTCILQPVGNNMVFEKNMQFQNILSFHKKMPMDATCSWNHTAHQQFGWFCMSRSFGLS